MEREHGAAPTQHYTVIFNTFVLMQIFNWLNCRKLYHERHVLQGVFNNWLFVSIWVTCAVTQFFLVQGSSLGTECGDHNWPISTTYLTPYHWIICIVFGATELVWQQVIITVTPIVFPGRTALPEPLTDEELATLASYGSAGHRKSTAAAGGAKTETNGAKVHPA